MHKKKVVTMKEDTLSCSPMNSTQMSVWDHMRRQSKDTDEAVNIAFQNFLKSTVEEGYAEQGATKTHEAGTVRITTCGDVRAKNGNGSLRGSTHIGRVQNKEQLRQSTDLH